MSNPAGRAGVNFGSGGTIVAAGFPGGGGAGVEIGIIRGALVDVTQVQDVIDKDALTQGRAFGERVWQLTLDIVVSADTQALAAAVLWPSPLATVTVQNACDGNAEVNGAWNVEPGGGWNFGSAEFRSGTIILTRRSASTADHTAGNAVALGAMG